MKLWEGRWGCPEVVRWDEGDGGGLSSQQVVFLAYVSIELCVRDPFLIEIKYIN